MNFHTSNNEKEGVSNFSQFDTPPRYDYAGAVIKTVFAFTVSGEVFPASFSVSVLLLSSKD